MRGKRKIKQSSHKPGGRPLRGPVVFFAVVILMSASVLMLVARRPSGKALVIGTMEHQPTDQKAGISAVATLTFFPVHVDGAVKEPGVYYLPEASIVSDAIRMAGGLLNSADQTRVNLAMLLLPHIKIYIPQIGEEHLPIPVQDVIQDPCLKIDLNRATRAELETLPGVGEATSQAIVNYREQFGPFIVIEDLMKVPGIKEAKFFRLKAQIYVTGP
ncbi:MAG: competence protein ComEA [Clostridiaceae bacterium]|jgi:competence protein ComEA|nr:competence protein ComEA [Clostridiaceae bacterium]